MTSDLRLLNDEEINPRQYTIEEVRQPLHEMRINNITRGRTDLLLMPDSIGSVILHDITHYTTEAFFRRNFDATNGSLNNVINYLNIIDYIFNFPKINDEIDIDEAAIRLDTFMRIYPIFKTTDLSELCILIRCFALNDPNTLRTMIENDAEREQKEGVNSEGRIFGDDTLFLHMLTESENESETN